MPKIDEMKMLFHRNWTIINDNNEIALMATQLHAAFSPLPANSGTGKTMSNFLKRIR
jgi:hypothetical protein